VLLNIFFFGRVSADINPEKLRSDSVSRILRVFTQSLGLTCTWCLCFAAHLYAIHLTDEPEGLKVRLLLALLQSFGCFVVIVILDAIADLKCSTPAVDKAIVMIIFALGASVGIAWEQAFHTCAHIAVEYMVEDDSNPIFRISSDPRIWAVCLSGIIVLTVFPAYRFYIVPRMYQMLEEYEHELHTREKEYWARPSMVGHHKGSMITENIFTWTGSSQLETEMVACQTSTATLLPSRVDSGASAHI